MIPPEALHPDTIRAELAEAEQRATRAVGLEAKRKRRKWILIAVFIVAAVVVGFAIVMVVLFGKVRSQGTAIGQLQQGQADLQQGQANQAQASKNGQALLRQVIDQGVTMTALAERLKDCTTPEGQCSQMQAKQAGTYVMNLQNSILAGQAEELRRIGQLFTAVGLTQAQVNRITSNFPTSAAAQKSSASVPGATTKTGGAPLSSTSTADCLATINTPVLKVDGTACPP